MANLVVIGSQWGDEGKGKIVDILAHDADVIVRFQGGSNAGHTVVTKKGTFVFHLIPSGILSKGKQCILGNGVVIDPGALIGELDLLQTQGIKAGKNFLSSGYAAQGLALFQYQYFAPGLSQAGGGYQAVVATAYYDSIISVAHG